MSKYTVESSGKLARLPGRLALSVSCRHGTSFFAELVAAAAGSGAAGDHAPGANYPNQEWNLWSHSQFQSGVEDGRTTLQMETCPMQNGKQCYTNIQLGEAICAIV